MQLIGKDSNLVDKVTIKDYNESHLKVYAESGIATEISEKFTFFADNYKYHPKYKARVWNGQISLYDKRNRTIPKGLLSQVEKFCLEKDYDIEYDGEFGTTEFSLLEAERYIKTLNLPSFLELRDYQIETFASCVRNKRRLFVSPTSSGKSFIMYLIYRYLDKKSLLIVPTIALVKQMQADFVSYGYNEPVHLIQGGTEKDGSGKIYISTYQSIVDMSVEWFDQFDVVFGDEAHKWQAKSLRTISDKMISVKYRFGFTGTLNESLTNEMVLNGIFGPTEQIVTTRELIDQGHLSEIKIKAICLKYPKNVKKQFHEERDQIEAKTKKYAHEIAFLCENQARNRFIKNLALSLKGNGLILFNRVDTHGVPLYDEILKETTNPCYIVHGSTDTDEREEVRKIVNTHENSITLGSMGVCAEGINIPNINWIILAHPSRSKIKVLQMIGRGLRKSDIKNSFTLFDISDELVYNKEKNYTIIHLAKRIQFYKDEQFHYKLFNVDLK